MLSPYFPAPTVRQIADLGLKESDFLDVLYNGEYIKTSTGGHSAVKKYPTFGYELGLYYKLDKYNNRYIITYVWRRDRR